MNVHRLLSLGGSSVSQLEFIQHQKYINMSYSKVKSLRPCSTTLDREPPSAVHKPSIPNSTNDSNKSPVPIANNNIHQKDPFYRKKSDGSVSDASTHSSLAGGKLTEAPGRLTPTCPGRMKAPPVCRDWALKRVASTVSDEVLVSFLLLEYYFLLCLHTCIFCLLIADARHSLFLPRRGRALCTEMFGSGRGESRNERGKYSIQY